VSGAALAAGEFGNDFFDAGLVRRAGRQIKEEGQLKVVNYDELRERSVGVSTFLIEKQIPFAVWALQIVQNHPDTIAKLTILNPGIKVVHVNVK